MSDPLINLVAMNSKNKFIKKIENKNSIMLYNIKRDE